MIDRIIDFSVRNKFLVLLVVGAAALAGARALQDVPLDAILDLGETQVIVYSRWERSPDVVESQVTYPIVTAMLGAPHVRAVRGFSDFGYSFVYVIFEDGTDTYWARTRTLEYLSGVLSRLPPDAKTELGPDATGLGWVFQYALVDRSGQRSLADLRSYQDWNLRYHLKAVPGVSEVASLGGFGRQYQVNVDPNRLRNYGLSIQHVVEAVRGGNALQVPAIPRQHGDRAGAAWKCARRYDSDVSVDAERSRRFAELDLVSGPRRPCEQTWSEHAEPIPSQFLAQFATGGFIDGRRRHDDQMPAAIPRIGRRRRIDATIGVLESSLPLAREPIEAAPAVLPRG